MVVEFSRWLKRLQRRVHRWNPLARRQLHLELLEDRTAPAAGLLKLEDIARELHQSGVTFTGVTIVTHGFQTDNLTGGDALLPLANAIHQRTGGYLINTEVGGEGAVAGFQCMRLSVLYAVCCVGKVGRREGG